MFALDTHQQEQHAEQQRNDAQRASRPAGFVWPVKWARSHVAQLGEAQAVITRPTLVAIRSGIGENANMPALANFSIFRPLYLLLPLWRGATSKGTAPAVPHPRHQAAKEKLALVHGVQSVHHGAVQQAEVCHAGLDGYAARH